MHLHFDAPSGAAGDMTLGALLDLGVPEAVIREGLGRLGVAGWRLEVRKAKRGGLVGTDVKVVIEEHGPGHDHDHDHGHDHGHDHDHDHDHGHVHGEHRHYAEIKEIIEKGCDPAVRELALRIFDLVAAAESKLHGVSVEEVAFHEVGAIDSIVDIVGAAIGLSWLAPSSVSATPPATGSGTVKAAHGILPVPAPATLEIARAAGMPVVDGGLARELLTPTGAAILAAVVQTWGPAPAMKVHAIGYGAGDADFKDRANLLRITVGEVVARGQAALVRLEANLDDMSPELCEHAAEKIFAAGALDVWWTPIVMKKSRPAFLLGVLAPAARRDEIIGVVLAETTTLGVRFDPVERRALDRRSETVETPWGPVPIKLGLDAGKVVNAAPEYEACRAIARAAAVPLKDVYAAAVAAWRSRSA